MKKATLIIVGVIIGVSLTLSAPLIAATASKTFTERVIFNKVIQVRKSLKNSKGAVKVNDNLTVTGKITGTVAAKNLGTGVLNNTEISYLDGATSNIQDQLDSKGDGTGDMLQSTYDVAGNNAIDADKIDSGLAATLINTGVVSNDEFNYLNGVTSALQTQLDAKGTGNGDMSQSTYDTGGNSAIDADKLDSGISAALISTGSVSNTEFDYLDSINFDNTSDLRLTALGYQAGNTIAAAGYRNTLVGYQAGDLITTGTDNTAIGNNTLGATTTTANNTAVGSGALAANTDTNNTAIGYDALTIQTTGNGNTAIGSKSLDANTTGDYNVAVGYDALGANTQSSSNTAIGYNAMASNQSTGNNNVAIGRNALDASTNGVWNVAVGYGTIGNGTGVDSSTAVGYLALASATGDNNIGIGYQAGNGITSGTNNIIIGHDADAPVATTSGQLNIGDTLYGDLSSDNLGLNTSTFDGTAAGVLAIANGTAPASGTANQAYIYARDVTASSEMHVMDEAGNETQISPHDPETGNWIYYSKNVDTGRVLRIEMEELMFDLAEEMSQKTGKQYIYEYYE